MISHAPVDVTAVGISEPSIQLCRELAPVEWERNGDLQLQGLGVDDQ